MSASGSFNLRTPSSRAELVRAHAHAVRCASLPAFSEFERQAFVDAAALLGRHVSRGTRPRRSAWYYVPAF